MPPRITCFPAALSASACSYTESAFWVDTENANTSPSNSTRSVCSSIKDVSISGGVAAFKTASGTGGCVMYAVESKLCSSCMMFTNASLMQPPVWVVWRWA
jgi:hypothetical protein